jgi:hypothetical protein
VIAGTRVSIDKNLFYDQTLPALVAQMDAERANPPNANVDSRRFLVGLAIDSFSAASLDRFAQTNGISV